MTVLEYGLEIGISLKNCQHFGNFRSLQISIDSMIKDVQLGKPLYILNKKHVEQKI